MCPGGDAAGAASCGRVACAVRPWGHAGAGRQGGRVLEHAEQRGALRLAEEAPRGCHQPSGYGAGVGGRGAGCAGRRSPKPPGCVRVPRWGRRVNGRRRRPVTPTARNALVVRAAATAEPPPPQPPCHRRRAASAAARGSLCASSRNMPLPTPIASASPACRAAGSTVRL